MQEFFHQQNHTTRTDTSDTEEVPATISCTCRQGPAQLSKALVCSVSFSMNMLECQWYDSMLYKTRSLKNNGYFSRGEFLMFLCAGKSGVSRLQWRQHPSAEKQISIWGHGLPRGFGSLDRLCVFRFLCVEIDATGHQNLQPNDCIRTRK